MSVLVKVISWANLPYDRNLLEKLNETKQPLENVYTADVDSDYNGINSDTNDKQGLLATVEHLHVVGMSDGEDGELTTFNYPTPIVIMTDSDGNKWVAEHEYERAF